MNMTLIFSATQALLAANAGARYVSPFVGRYDDIALDGLAQLGDIVTCIKNYDWSGKNPDSRVEIITASVRTPNHVTQAALMGADIATVPMKVLRKCLHHPLTDAVSPLSRRIGSGLHLLARSFRLILKTSCGQAFYRR